jgi:nicotinate-nucleotide adenylyltransferase
MTKIAILGGAFDPPTIGHVKLAEVVLKKGGFDEVWLTPCYNHSYEKDLRPSQARLDMCAIATRGHKNIHVFDYEIRHKLNGSTYSFIRRLSNDEDLDVDISFIIGQDNANTFHKWHMGDSLKKMAKFVVVTREGIPVDDTVDWYREPPHSVIDAGDEIPKCSSTAVREYIGENGREEPVPMLDDAVRAYIKKQSLYHFSPKNVLEVLP